MGKDPKENLLFQAHIFFYRDLSTYRQKNVEISWS